jgi:hypothetical protein
MAALVMATAKKMATGRYFFMLMEQ